MPMPELRLDLVLLFVHIGAGSLGILSGFAAVIARKGSGPHRAAGKLFVAAMLAMTLTATGVAVIRHQPANVMAAALTAYLVVTAWVTVLRRPGSAGAFEGFAALWAFAVAGFGVWMALAHISPFGSVKMKGDFTPMFFIFSSLATLGGLTDLKTLRSGGLRGAARLSRHLWRLCLALFIASSSFFLGQMKVIPHALRGPHLWVLAFLPLAVLLFWIIRVRFRPWSRPKASAEELRAAA